MLPDQNPGRFPEIPGAGVGTQAGPGPQRVLGVGAGQILWGRECLQEPQKIGDAGLNPGLPQHHFRYPAGVIVARFTPGKLAVVLPLIGGDQLGLQGPDFGWRQMDCFGPGRLRHATRAEFIRLEIGEG